MLIQVYFYQTNFRDDEPARSVTEAAPTRWCPASSRAGRRAVSYPISAPFGRLGSGFGPGRASYADAASPSAVTHGHTPVSRETTCRSQGRKKTHVEQPTSPFAVPPPGLE